MATNIEQIFRSFVVSKFREIQEQQFGGGKVGGQQNGEINSSEQVSPSGNTISSIGNLQNDPLVQKIEQVLSEVLGAESQYKPDGGEDTARNKSRSTKRGLYGDVQDEIPRKKSKKDKKHKDKKKKKKRKKEKKYKKQSKESQLNTQFEGSGDMQLLSHSKPESSSSVLSADDVDIGPLSPLKQASEWFMEKTVYENLNSPMSNLHDASSSDTSKLDTSEEESSVINIQEPSEVEHTNERELQSDTYEHINLAVNLYAKDEYLNTAQVESGEVYMDGDGVAKIKEVEQSEAISTLETTEKVSAPENSPKSAALELEDLEISLESDTVEGKDMDTIAESLHVESMKKSVPVSFEKTGYKLMRSPLEPVGEAKDSVTTLGFLAMVVGKDFEATSEFLNTAKVKASEVSPKHDAVVEMKDLRIQDSERPVIIKDLEKNLQTNIRAKEKDVEETPESLHVITEKNVEPTLVYKSKSHPKGSNRMRESDPHECRETTLDAEMGLRELRETQPSAIMVEWKMPEQYPEPLEIAADVKGLRNTLELEVMNRMGSKASLSDAVVERKDLEADSRVEKMDMRVLKAQSECAEIENRDNVPQPHRLVGVKSLDRSPECEGKVQVDYLETSLENLVKRRGDSKTSADSDAVVDTNVSESILRPGTVPEINDLEIIPESPHTVTAQYLEVTKNVAVADIEGETVTVSESQYVKETNLNDISQSGTVLQQRDSEILLKPVEERDVDATSESLHMIFTNYSEHSLELYRAPESMMELKKLETIPDLSPMVDAKKSEALHTREVKDLKTVDSEIMIGSNVLKEKIDSLQTHVRNLEDFSESKQLSTVKCSKILVAPDTVAKRKRPETASYSVAGVKEKAAGSTECVEEDQNRAEVVDFEILPKCQKVTKRDPKRVAENVPFAKIESSLFISKSTPEETPELGTAMIRELKETVGLTSMVDADRPNETSTSTKSKDASKFVNVSKDIESCSECHTKTESLQLAKTKVNRINLDSLYALGVKYSGASPKCMLSDESSDLKEKQKLEERMKTTGPITTESLDVSQRDLTIIPEADETNKVMNSKHGRETLYLAKTNSENNLKSLHIMQMKDSKSASGSKIMDVEHFEDDSKSLFKADVEIGEDSSRCEPGSASEIFKIISESPKKNEIPLESQSTSVVQVSDEALEREVFTVKNLEVDSETIRVINIDNLEVSPECEELKVVKKSEAVPASLFALDIIYTDATASSSVHKIGEELKTTKIDTDVEIKKLTASTPVDMRGESYESSCITDVKRLEANQKFETNLEYLNKMEVNIYKESSVDSDTNGSGAFQRCAPLVGTHMSEIAHVAVGKAEEKDQTQNRSTDQKQNANSSASVSESVNLSQRVTYDSAVSVSLLEVKDSGVGSHIVDTGEMEKLKTTLQFEATPVSVGVFKSRDSDDAVESVSVVETKDLGKTLNYDTVLEVQDHVVTGTHRSTPELKSSGLVCEHEGTDPEGILELNTTPVYLDASDLKPCTTTETKALEKIDCEINLKPETTLAVKYFESASEAKYVLETCHYEAAPESEGMMEEKNSEPTSELVCMEHVETTPNSKTAQKIIDIECPPQSVEVRDLEESVIYDEVLDASEITPQFSSIVEVKELGTATSSVIAEAVKDSETHMKYTQISNLTNTCENVEPVCSLEENAEMTGIADVKNSEALSRYSGTEELKDAELLLKCKNALEPVQSKSGFEATPKRDSIEEEKEKQADQMSLGQEEGLHHEGLSKSVLVLERETLDRNSSSVLVSEEKISEASLQSSHSGKAKYSEAVPEYMNAKDVEVLKQNSKQCMAEIKNVESFPGHVGLTEAKNSEMVPQISLEMKNSEATLKPLTMTKEKDLDGTSKEQDLQAVLKSICSSAKEILEANQEAPIVLNASEATLMYRAEKQDLEAEQQATVEDKTLHMTKEKDMEAAPQASLKEQDSESISKSSDIVKENEGSILKDKKSEKISSKSKDKSKSGKKAKKSRSKSPSKSKKHKKKSRSHSTSRQVASRRTRSKSRNDSDSRKKHSTSRHKSRSKSSDKKEGKESSLRSRRRRSRTPKSRSKSVELRETSIKSRRRRSRSSDHKSRSRSVDKRESTKTKRRLSMSSDNYKSKSRSVEKRENLIRSRRRRSKSSDHHKSRSPSTDRRDSSIRTRRRRSRSSEIHRSRSRSVDKADTSVKRRRRRRSRSSDNYKSRSKSLDRRELSIRSRRRRSRSSDYRKSRSKSVDDKRETSVRTRRKRSRSPDNRKSRSISVDKRETSVRTRRRRSRSYDHRSRSKSVDKTSVQTKRKRSRSSDHCKSRSKSVDKRETSIRARRRQSRSPDNSRSADKGETSSRSRRKRSRSSDNRKSRSRSVDKEEPLVRTRRRRSRSSDNRKSRSRSADKRESSVRTRRRRSRSLDNRKSRSRSADKRESSVRTKRRRSRSCHRRSRSKSVDKRDTSVRSKRRRSRSFDNHKSRSKSVDKTDTSVRAKRKRSRSSDNHKSRSKSVDKIDTSEKSKRRRSKSVDHKCNAKPAEKGESSLRSRRTRSKSLDRQRSKSKSRSKSSERRKEKDTSDASREKHSKSRSKSKSVEKTQGTESLEASVCNHTKSPEHHKSKSRSKSLDKTGEKESSRRSRSKDSKSSEPKSRSHRTVSRSRRNRSRSRKRTSRSKSNHRSLTRSQTRSRSCSRRWRRSRSRSASRQRSLSRERRRRSRRNRSRSTDRRRRRSDSRDSFRVSLRIRSRSRTPARLRCSRSTGRRRSTSTSPDHRRSRSSSRSPKRLTDLDKAQLLEIAKANAAAMCAKAGVPLPPSLMPVITPEKKEEKVTQKSAKETIMELTEKCKKIAQSQEDDVILNKPHVSDEEEEEHPFINHPFKLNEPKPIFFNLTTPTIKPATPKNQVTLTKEFPVSSGSQHRKKEADSAYGEWVPVEKNKDENKDDVFPNPANLEPVDISSALSERTIAQKRLTENTFDLEAMCLLNRAQERIDAWAQLNSLPGQFTGSTGAQVLSSEQLSNSGPQAWIKKDQFLRAAPVSGGMGAQLMRKMGWREGEGLGKNKEGNREPILVDFKTDRKGLVAVGEKTQKRHGPFSTVKDLSGKHPVSALVEVCNKRRWSPPVFVLVNDNGPDHRKHFLFKVMVNGVEHKPNFASPNKKHAKATAATVALQALGLVPKELLANATSFRSASHN